MPLSELLSQFQDVAERASVSITEYGSVMTSIQQYILDNFGPKGLYAAYISAAAVGILVFWKLVKLSFAALKYMVVPAVAIAFVGSFFLPYSFSSLLPVTVTGCSLFLLFKA
ncbi:MAG TPA: hypothetical protein VHP63_01360 [candidate division Zixibacteria bacterium]|nr:hypothetical protein [candidate division Zixibacteria bacterium]